MVTKQEIHPSFSFCALSLEANLKIAFSYPKMQILTYQDWADEAVAPISLVALSQAPELLTSRTSPPCKAQMAVQSLAKCCHPCSKTDFQTFCFPVYCKLVFRSPKCPPGCSDCIHAYHGNSSFYVCWWRSSMLLLHLGAAWLKSAISSQCSRSKGTCTA